MLAAKAATEPAPLPLGRALGLQARACLTTPSLLLSPFLARPLWWEIKKSVSRSTAP